MHSLNLVTKTNSPSLKHPASIYLLFPLKIFLGLSSCNCQPHKGKGLRQLVKKKKLSGNFRVKHALKPHLFKSDFSYISVCFNISPLANNNFLRAY